MQGCVTISERYGLTASGFTQKGVRKKEKKRTQEKRKEDGIQQRKGERSKRKRKEEELGRNSRDTPWLPLVVNKRQRRRLPGVAGYHFLEGCHWALRSDSRQSPGREALNQQRCKRLVQSQLVVSQLLNVQLSKHHKQRSMKQEIAYRNTCARHHT